MIAKQLLADKAYEFILEEILNGELLPGEMVNRRSLAKELNMSAAPVLEAMVRLESEGFVETLPRKGTRIRIIRAEEVRGQLVLRAAVECQAARLCCGEPVKNNMEKLQELAAIADKPHTDPIANWESEYPFHRVFVELADCRELLSAFDRIMSRSLFYTIHYLLKTEKTDMRMQHVELLKLMKTSSEDKAEKAMRRHIESGYERVFSRDL